MKMTEKITIIEHAVDNDINPNDYEIYEILEERQNFLKIDPNPCDILPRQFGYWYHTGPGFAPTQGVTYGHKILLTKNARILGCDGAIVYGAGWIDSTSLNYVRTDLPGCQFSKDGDLLLSYATSRTLSGRYFMGFNAGHNNYAHWVTDQLPLVYYYTENLAKQGVKLLLPKNLKSFVSQYIQLLKIDRHLIEYIGDEVLEIEYLLHPSFFSYDAIPVSACELLRSFRQTCLPKTRGAGRRIFVSRRDALSRVMLNENKVLEILQSFGFELVVPGNLSLGDQIAAFADADVVIGGHGAALANIVFCRPGTKVLEIFPEYTVSSLFWMLASHFELQYGALFGTSFDQDQALVSQAGSWDAPFVVSEAGLRRFVSDC